METKKCKVCHKEKSILDFYLLKDSGYRWGKCKECHAKYAHEWRVKNPKKYHAIMERSVAKNGDKIKEAQKRYGLKHPEKRKEWKLRDRYGISLDEYYQIMENQKGLCAVCKQKEQLFVDHCHNTKKIRGLLCCTCNMGLGAFHDDINNLKSAIKYLTKNKE